MRLTALWVCGTLLAFSSLSWITAGSDEGLLLGDKGFGPCAATLRPDGPCSQDEGSCPYLFSLPPLTVHLPQQLRELEKIMEDLQKLKDSVDQLRELCADCTVSQTERECGRQREHEKLSEGKDECEDKRNWMNERLQENDRDFRQEFGTDTFKVEKTEGEGDSENRFFLEEKERGKWEPERESDKGVIKENEKERTRTGVAEKDGKSQTEGAKAKDKLGQTKVPTAGGNEKKVAITREKGADKNTRERETDEKKENAGIQNQKQYQEDKLESEKERKVQPPVWQGETKETEKNIQTEASDKIKMSEDHDVHAKKEQEQHEDERKKEMEKGIKVEQNIEKQKQTESIRRTEKETTIKEGEVEEKGRKTGKEIKTEKEKTENVQRNSDGELSSNKAIERTDFVSISPTPRSIINIAFRPDSNKATIFTSSIPSLSLPSSTLDLITDVSHEAITAYGPTQSTGLGAAAKSEPSHPDAESDTTTATISTLGGPRQQKTSATAKFNSASTVGPRAGFQGHSSSTTPTTTPHQNLYITASPRATDQSHWTAKKNISSNTKTGVKPLPEEDQKLKNPKNDRKSDQAPFPDKKTKQDQKQKLPFSKPANNPERVMSKSNPKTPPNILPTDQKLKSNLTPKHNQDHRPDQNKSPLQKPKPHQKPGSPVRIPISHRKPQTGNATSSDKHPLINQKQKPSLYSPTTDQSKPANSPEGEQIPQPDQRTLPDILPTDRIWKNNLTTKGDQSRRPDQNKSPLQKPKSHQKPGTPVRTLTSHYRPKTVNVTSSDKHPLINQKQKPSLNKPTTDQFKPAHDPEQDQTSKPDQRTPPDILPTDQSLKNNPTTKGDQDHRADQNKLPLQKPKSHQTPVVPVQRPTSHQKPQTVNTTNSDKHPLIHQKQNPSLYNPTTDQSKPANDPEQEQIPKPDRRTPSDILPTDQNLKNNPTVRQDQDQTLDQNKSPLQTPKSHQKPATPGNPISHRKPETANATHSDQHPLTNQKQNASLYNATTDQLKPPNDSERDQTSKHDQRTLSDLLPTDQTLKNNPILKGDQDRRPDQNKSPLQKPKPHQKPMTPVWTPTSHQRHETVNVTRSGKYPLINQKQKPSLYNSTTDQSKPANNPERDQISKPDQRIPSDVLPTDQNQKNNPTTKGENKLPTQKPKSHDAPVVPVQRPASHQRPETVNATHSDKHPLITQNQNPSHYKPPTDQSKPAKNTQVDEISKPDQRTLSDIVPSDKNLKSNPLPKHDQDRTSDQQPDQLNKLPIEKPNSGSVAPVQRPTSLQNVNATYSDKYLVIEPAQESDGTPVINQNSKLEEKLVYPVKMEPAEQEQKPERKPNGEEETQPDQNVELNQYPQSVQDPESKRNDTESFTPKPNQKTLTESKEKSDASPSFEPKSNEDSTPGQKVTPDRDNTPPDQKPKPSLKIPKMNQKPKPGLGPKPNQKHPRPVTEIKTKPNVHRKTDQAPQTNQSLNTPRPGQIPDLNAKSVPGAGPEAKPNKTPKPRPPPRYRPPVKPAVKPGATPIQRPRPAVQPKPNAKTKTHLNPTQISWTTSDDVQNSQTDMPPTAGPAKQITEVTHSPRDTEFSPSMRKTITLAPKTYNSLETGASPHLHTLPEDFTTSPNSRSMSDLRPQTASQPPSIPVTTRPNKIIRKILPSVIPSTRPGPTKPNLTPKSEPSLQAEIIHNVETTAPAGPVPPPSSQTTSRLSPDFRSTTPATSGPEPPAAEASTPSTRELRVKINQVAAFLNNSLNPNGRPPHRHLKEQPEDTQGGSRPDKTDSKLPTPTPSKVVYRDCSDHLLRGEAQSGVYLVTPDPRGGSFPVFCDMEREGGGWTVLQRRQDGSVSFNRTWAEYQTGFGQLDGGEFWLGNDLIHLLTRDRDMVLRVELEDFEGVAEFAQYEQFRVASERLRYRLTVGGYWGTAGDALRFNKRYDHNHRAFTTPDRDHDRYPSGNCGVYYSSGWWFDACMAANLNGRYYEGRYKGVRDGIFWGTWHNISTEYYPTNDRQSFKSVRMMVRPKGFAP
ncbi:mucin-2-like [Amphiprion ocellaris]|uniref:Fibrinogen C-terminal domain-containing protein n=1 Tax=Amphiprion ocellaris TaxID=80972 RepID=A0A3Q1CBS1_AMPOC|nr:mucin-2-like [Amphiprion ocellaris]